MWGHVTYIFYWDIWQSNSLDLFSLDSPLPGVQSVLLKLEFFAVWALKSLVIQGKEASILADIQKNNWDGLQEDVVAKAAAVLKAG